MESIELCRVSRVDANELIAANRESHQYHHPWVAPFTEQTGFDSWYSRSLTGANVGLVVREYTSKEVVGIVNINEIVGGVFQSAYLSYYGMSKFQRRGLMTSALHATVSYAFEELGLHRLEANIQPMNHASIALVRRVGFLKEGFSPGYLCIDGKWCDHERWAIRSS
ncbi:GNAT family N-acetyltransferase [Comamonas sp. Tr-654]|uniref:GNAT family N-acetyltransferase n=1 Tax=Comamonas sp. Tr-654 TaxID=2608341 RepID=UPI0014216ED8|nr:GNAT family N-acetyltransferase [Comamonas sp. Tr-654]NIF81898.1 GNAT family N-acetyltransferase [Comamonas sp. Tr-654]